MITARRHWLWTPLVDRYVMHKLRASFRGVWLQGQLPADEPLILYANHCGFWDGFVIHALARGSHLGHAVMEEHNLSRYRFLTRIGALSVRRADARSALETLRHCRALLKQPRSAVLLFPEGELMPGRHALHFERGLEVLARMSGARCVPVAIRYAMFEHELPDVLLSAGEAHTAEPVQVSEARLEGLLQELDRLETPFALSPLVRGRRSVAERWDLARGLPARSPQGAA